MTAISICVLAMVLPIGLFSASAEDQPPASPAGNAACELSAVLGPATVGWRAAYDGIRAGLERARLPRVCLEEVNTPADVARLERRLSTLNRERVERREARLPFFLVGDQAVQAHHQLAASEPRVAVVERYAVGDEFVRPLPKIGKVGTVVVARVDAARVGRVVRLVANATSATLPVSMSAPERPSSIAFMKGAGIRHVGAGERPVAVLHLRLESSSLPALEASFERAKAKAQRWRVPLIADQRERFDQGATLVLMPDYELVGRIAADAARVLAMAGTTSESRTSVRVVYGLRMWVNLRAADRAKLTLPMVLLSHADRIRRGVSPNPSSTPATSEPGR